MSFVVIKEKNHGSISEKAQLIQRDEQQGGAQDPISSVKGNVTNIQKKTTDSKDDKCRKQTTSDPITLGRGKESYGSW